MGCFHRERGPTVAQQRLFREDRWKRGWQTPFLLDEPDFAGPIRCRAQPFHVWMTSQQRSFDFRNLPAAAGDSYACLPALLGSLLEGAAVVELGLLPAQRLPPLHNTSTYFGPSSIRSRRAQ